MESITAEWDPIQARGVQSEGAPWGPTEERDVEGTVRKCRPRLDHWVPFIHSQIDAKGMDRHTPGQGKSEGCIREGHKGERLGKNEIWSFIPISDPKQWEKSQEEQGTLGLGFYERRGRPIG